MTTINAGAWTAQVPPPPPPVQYVVEVFGGQVRFVVLHGSQTTGMQTTAHGTELQPSEAFELGHALMQAAETARG